jgi:phosphoglycolate phosphatase-like HAD superfamily hydrolase
MQKPVFDTRSIEPNNMAHLLLDIIPYCLNARRAAGPEVVFLFYKLVKHFRELLDIFGLTTVFEHRRIEADVVKMRGTHGLAAFDLLLPNNTLGAPGICFLPHVYSDIDFSLSTKFDKVFLARRGPRRLLNHSEVEETVARFGYRTVFMEDYSLLDQLSIGAQAKHVVAIHGAAMSFLVTNRQIDSIVELLAPYTYHELFPVAFGSRVRHYEQIIPRFDRAVASSIGLSDWLALKDLPFAIDTSLLASLLANIH